MRTCSPSSVDGEVTPTDATRGAGEARPPPGDGQMPCDEIFSGLYGDCMVVLKMSSSHLPRLPLPQLARESDLLA